MFDEFNGGVGVEWGKIRIIDWSGVSFEIDLWYVVDFDDVFDVINFNGMINVCVEVDGDCIWFIDNMG